MTVTPQFSLRSIMSDDLRDSSSLEAVSVRLVWSSSAVLELHVAGGPLLELVRGLPHFEGSELLKCESDDGWASYKKKAKRNTSYFTLLPSYFDYYSNR